ncbi:UNVERIFIED_CONTAM: hypothetical protein Sradi_5965600 [Sesamum radiatum]|uniref:Uncharacterized protein n=1 Tax=Sesamum radiatum TaxID=300843 RepID=A0AAW2KI23_SESRA
MELPYLLCSILSTAITSLFLSVLLPFRYFLRRIATHAPLGTPATLSLFTRAPYGTSAAALSTTHSATRSAMPSSTSTVRPTRRPTTSLPMMPVVLPRPMDLCNFPHSLTSIRIQHLRFLLTIPPSVGYEQNPLSLYYCYDVEGSKRTLRKCIAEVTNTPWGERVTFLFNPNSDLVAKPLHVSPFMTQPHHVFAGASLEGWGRLGRVYLQKSRTEEGLKFLTSNQE